MVGAAVLTAAVVLGGGIAAVSVPASAAAAPSELCSADKLYGIVNYPIADPFEAAPTTSPSQIMEYSLDPDGNIASYTELSEVLEGELSTGNGSVAVMDGLGLGIDCSFYFAQNTDFVSSTPQIDLYRYNPAEGNTPVLMQQNFSMNSPTAANVNAGAVSPAGEYYFGYFSRQEPTDSSDATTEALRLHLYRFVYEEGRDPVSTEQPNVRSGEVAHVDIEIAADSFRLSNGDRVSTDRIHGDLAFDQAGNLIAFVSSESSLDQLSLLLPKAQFDGIDGTWKSHPGDPYKPVPLVNTASAAHTNFDLVLENLYMGAAYRADGKLQTLSFAANAEGKHYDLGFSQIDPMTLEHLPGTYSQIAVPPLEGYGDRMVYPMDLASNQFAGTFASSLSVDELRDTDADRFALTLTDASGAELGVAATAAGETVAAFDPVLAAPGEYTVTQTISANAEFYSTAWSCATGVESAVPVTGVGLSATITVAAGESVACEFTNTLNRVAVGTPEIVGDLTIGSTLTAKPGADWGPAGVEFEYQWLRGGKPIAGAQSDHYTLTETDLGSEISVMVLGSMTGHVEASQTSAIVVPIAAVRPAEPGAGGKGSGLVNTGAGLATYGIAGIVTLLLGAGTMTAAALRRRRNA